MRLLYYLSSISLLLRVVSGGNTTCADDGMSWYTDLVGETPCRTYERLRQICNSQYQVGIQNVNTPPDACDEQLADCCCNSISFALSMLCLSCQQGFSSNPNGYDAGVGAYQIYLTGSRTNGFCRPNVNQTLPDSIQSAVCNQKIKIFDSLYSLFWNNGAWFYQFTFQTLTRDIASKANNTFTHCDSTTLHSTTSSSSSSTSGTAGNSEETGSATGSSDSSSSESSSGSLAPGPIAGISVASVLGVLALAGVLWWCFWRKKKRQVRKFRFSRDEGFSSDIGHGGIEERGVLDGGSGQGSTPPMSETNSELRPRPYPFHAYSYSPVPSGTGSASASMSALGVGVDSVTGTGLGSSVITGSGSGSGVGTGTGTGSDSTRETGLTTPYTNSPPSLAFSKGRGYQNQGNSAGGRVSSDTQPQSQTSSGLGSATGPGTGGVTKSGAGIIPAGGAGPAGVGAATTGGTRKSRIIHNQDGVNDRSGDVSGFDPYQEYDLLGGSEGAGRDIGSETQMTNSERHTDAGPIPLDSYLQRSRSGRLPPAYGDIVS